MKRSIISSLLLGITFGPIASAALACNTTQFLVPPAQVLAYRFIPTQPIMFGGMMGMGLPGRPFVDINPTYEAGNPLAPIETDRLHCSFTAPSDDNSHNIDEGTKFLVRGPGTQSVDADGFTVQEFPSFKELENGEIVAGDFPSLRCKSRNGQPTLLQIAPSELNASMKLRSFRLE